MKKSLIAVVLLWSSFVIANPSWELNDVSILFDLPQKGETLSALLGPSTQGKKGQLLPHSVFDPIKPLLFGLPEAPKDEYAALRVVAARLDPCFTYTTSSKCFPQIRLVWQPVGETPKGFTTFDAGLHSFYQLNPKEWGLLTARMQGLKLKLEGLKVSTAGRRLGIHPALTNPATRAIFKKELTTILLDFCGTQSLNRVTFMKLFTPEIWWVFGGFEIRNGQMIKMKLPRHNKSEEVQNFFNDDYTEAFGMKGAFTPELINPTQQNELTEVLKNYSYNFSTADGRKLVKESLATLDRIENPAFFTPETLDCAHCHLAGATRAWLGAKEPAFYRENQKTPYRYPGQTSQTSSTGLKNSKSMRMFGYQGSQATVAQRVINESIEVTKRLNLGKASKEN